MAQEDKDKEELKGDKESKKIKVVKKTEKIKNESEESEKLRLKELQKADEKLQNFKLECNELVKKQKKRYGYLRGFKKSVFARLQNELDGGDERELTAIDINYFRMPR